MLKSIINAKLNKDYEKIIIAKINKMVDDRTAIAVEPETHFKVYLKATTLNGFNYLEFTLISPVEIKTMGGCTLTFAAENDSYELKSESDIIESDYSNNSKIGITLVDADLDDDFAAFIAANTVNQIKVDCKVGQVFKKEISFSYSEIDMAAFRKSMVPQQAEGTGEMSSIGGGSDLGI